MDAFMDGRKDARIHGSMDGWVDGSMDGVVCEGRAGPFWLMVMDQSWAYGPTVVISDSGQDFGDTH